MSPLEIVLVSVVGALIIVVMLYLLILKANTRNHLETFKILNENAKLNANVFFGDSLTDFFPVQDFFPEEKIYNRGIAGDTTTDLLKRIDNIIELQPSKVFIQIGTNDLGKFRSPKHVIKNIEKIYQILRAEVPNITIVMISLYPITRRKMWLSPIIVGIRSNKQIRKTNEMLKELTVKYDIPYLDMYTPLSDAKGRMNKAYTLEGLHISGVGYQVIAKEITNCFVDCSRR